MRSQSNGDRDCLTVIIERSDQTWDTDRQRPGLVEHDRVGFGETLKSPAVLHHDAGLEQPAGRDHLNHRYRETERARARDDQHGNGDRHRKMHIGGCDEPADKRRERRQVYHRRIEARGAVRDTAVAGASCSAASIVRTISPRNESPDVAVATMVRGPVKFSVPARRTEPAATGTGACSPDTSETSISDVPLMTVASTGTRSPAASKIVIPVRISFIGR